MKNQHPWAYRMTFHVVSILQGLLGLVTLAQFEPSLQLMFARWYALRQAQQALREAKRASGC